MRLERVEFEMQKAGYEQKIAHLQAKFHQQTAEVDKVLQLLQQFFQRYFYLCHIPQEMSIFGIIG